MHRLDKLIILIQMNIKTKIIKFGVKIVVIYIRYTAEFGAKHTAEFGAKRLRCRINCE